VEIEPRCNVFGVTESVWILLPPVLVDHRDSANVYLERKFGNLIVLRHEPSLTFIKARIM
jgi:hypothetical protein